MFFELLDVFGAKAFLVQQRLSLFVSVRVVAFCMLTYHRGERQCRCDPDYPRRFGWKSEELAKLLLRTDHRLL